MRTLTSRAFTTATAAVLALTIIGIQPAAAGHRQHNGAVALAAFAAMLGVAAVIVATQQHGRHHGPYGQEPMGYAPGRHGHWRHHHHPYR
jgi:hypothetical protein